METHPPQVVIFDVNETLTDLRPLAPEFERHGLHAREAQTWFAAVLRDGFALSTVGQAAGFADIGGALLADSLTAAGHDEASRDVAIKEILGTFSSLDVHEDVPEGLDVLAEAGCTLITLSNGSTSVAETVLENAGVRDLFAACLSVDDAGAWKPAARAYEYALEHTGRSADRALLIACHPWDLHGARGAGLRTGFVDRSGRTWPSHFDEPELRASSLPELAQLISR